MKKLKITILVILLNVLMIKTIEACDLLSVNIGGVKSTLDFMVIEDEDLDYDSSVTVFESDINSFCTDIDFGNVILKTYISGNKIGAVEIKVIN